MQYIRVYFYAVSLMVGITVSPLPALIRGLLDSDVAERA